MKCQSLFSGKNKKDISECHMLKFLPSMQRVKGQIACIEIARALSASFFVTLCTIITLSIGTDGPLKTV